MKATKTFKNVSNGQGQMEQTDRVIHRENILKLLCSRSYMISIENWRPYKIVNY